MKKTIGFLVTAAAILGGCAGGGATTATQDLAWVPTSIDGRTDMFLDHGRLVTSVSESAISVDVAIHEWTLTATRHGTSEIIARWTALEEVPASEIVGATPIDGELMPGHDVPITVPQGGYTFGNPGVPGDGIDFGDRPGLIIDWSQVPGSIPGEVDAREWEGLDAAHPGCA